MYVYYSLDKIENFGYVAEFEVLRDPNISIKKMSFARQGIGIVPYSK